MYFDGTFLMAYFSRNMTDIDSTSTQNTRFRNHARYGF